MAIKVQGQTVVGDDRKGSFQVSNPGSFTTAQRDALSAVAGDQVFNTDTDKLEIYDGSDWKGVGSSGNTVSSTEPADKEIGDLWTDTSSDPPVLKTWDGSDWITYAAGGGTGGYAGQITNLTLAEDDTSGARFTGKQFNATFAVTEGSPVTQKSVKGEVTANFSVYPNTEPVDSVNATLWPNAGSNVSVSSSGRIDRWQVTWPVNEPNKGRQGFLHIGYKSGGGSYVEADWSNSASDSGESLVGSNTIPTVGDVSLGGYAGIILPPTANDPKPSYIWNSDNDKDSYRYSFNEDGSLQYSRLSDKNYFHFDEATQTYYVLSYEYRTSQSDYGFWKASVADLNANNKNWWDPISSTPTAWTRLNGISLYDYNYFADRYAAYGNGRCLVVLQYYAENSSSTKRWYAASVGFNNTNGSSKSMGFVSDLGALEHVSFAAGYFWVNFGTTPNTYSSQDGINWTLRSLIVNGTTYRYIRFTRTDADGSAVLGVQANSSTSLVHLRTNNGGATYTVIPSSTVSLSGSSPRVNGVITGNGYYCYSISASDSPNYQYSPTNTQVVTLDGQGEDYSEFNVGDSVKKDGDPDTPLFVSKIIGISGNQFTLQGEKIFEPNDIIVAVIPTSTAIETRYLKINSVGEVTGTLAGDPGYTEFGPATAQDFTFANTFDTGRTPDEELPTGTQLKIYGQIANASATDTYGPSNSVTPSD